MMTLQYEINKGLEFTSIKIIDGKFKDLEFTLDDFNVNGDKLTYNYRIVSGSVELPDGTEFKSTVEYIVNDLINEYSLH
jgi:hypothetical protein